MNSTAFSSRHKLSTPRTDEQKQAIRDLAGRRKDDPSMDRLMQEVEEYRESIRQEEISRQDAVERK